MLLTKASEYALLAINFIAKSDSPKDVNLIATKLGLSKSFLAKILQNLVKGGLLLSFKGVKGGFVLAKKPDEISIVCIIECAEKKKLSVFECSNGICPAKKELNCSIFSLLNNLQDKIDNFLSSLTLKDIMDDKNEKLASKEIN